MRLFRGDYSPESGIHTFGDKVRLTHDIGNNGEPARLPGILVEALQAIDPRKETIIIDPNDYEPRTPTAVVLLSQYAPNGLLYNALDHVASTGTYVYVPLQPDNDHHSNHFPFNLNYALFKRRVGSEDPDQRIIYEKREVASHVKFLIVKYDNGTVKMNVGTDNFVTNLQKVVRNEEIAVSISLDLKNATDAVYFHDVVNMLFDIGEIDSTTKDKLLLDT